jgi:hypothetical protein
MVGNHGFLWFSGLYNLARNTSRFESRDGYPAKTQHIFPASHQQRNNDLASHSVRQSHIIPDLQRRPGLYVPSSQIQPRDRPSNSHALQIKSPNFSHQFTDRNTFYRQPGFNERKQEAGTHQIASRVYPYKLGPNKLTATPNMHFATYEMFDGKPPQGMFSNIQEMPKETPNSEEMPTSGNMTHDYIDTEPHHDTKAKKPYDYHFDHSYDSYEYMHHDHLTEKPTTTPPPPTTKNPPFTYFRVGFKLYYIPLYAAMAFVGYVLILIINSIQRHKGKVPFDFLTNPPSRMLRDDVAERVIRALETARKRYKT